MSGRDAHQQQVQQVVVPKHATITPEEGGLHIGGVVILPSQSGRRGVSAAVTHDGSAGGAAAATNDHINWASSAGGGRSTNDESDDSGSMDQDLLDYMINLIEQAGSAASSSDCSGASDRHGRSSDHDVESDGAAVDAGAAADSACEDEHQGRQGLGWPGCIAATTAFAACSLGDPLQAQLGRDLYSASGSSSSSDSSSDSDSDSDSNASALRSDDRHMAQQQRFPVSTMSQQQQQLLLQRYSHPMAMQPLQRVHSSQRAGQRANTAASSTTQLPVFLCQETAVIAAQAVGDSTAPAKAARLAAASRRQRLSKSGRPEKGLARGEKANLRQERMVSKRTVRDLGRGSSALELLATIEAFAGSGYDMQQLQPVSKERHGFVRALAAVFGVQASPRGSGKKRIGGGRKILILTQTHKTALLDSPSSNRAQQLRKLLSEELVREAAATVFAEDKLVEAPTTTRTASAARLPPQSGRTRQEGRHAHGIITARSAWQASSSRGRVNPALQQPVSFVCGGLLNPVTDPHASSNGRDSCRSSSSDAQGKSIGEGSSGSGSDSGGSQAEQPSTSAVVRPPPQQQQQQQQQTCIVDASPWQPEQEPAVQPPLYERAAMAPLGTGSSACLDEQGLAVGLGASQLTDVQQRLAALGATSTDHYHQQQQQQRGKQHAARRTAGARSRPPLLQAVQPDTAAGPSLPPHGDGDGIGGAAAAGGAAMMLNLTAQQVKRARKQAARNARREARAADAGTGQGIGGGPALIASFGAFEAHTTGIGSRLLARAGWSVGEGLGASRSGRAEPLQVRRRPRTLGLGAEQE